MSRGVTLPQASPGRQFAASDGSSVVDAELTARAQTITGEIATLRDRLDEHLASGRLSLAAECAPELERLRIEMARLRIGSA